VVNAPENSGRRLGDLQEWAARWAGRWALRDSVTCALFLPLGMASAAQYALWFNAAMCLGAMVSALMLPRTSHS
jgi:DHA2 family multidrug resistance protein-like MFS transporter